MVTTLKTFPDEFYWKISCILIKISLKIVANGPIGNKVASVHAIGWCRKGDKPLSEPMMTQFTDAYKCFAIVSD